MGLKEMSEVHAADLPPLSLKPWVQVAIVLAIVAGVVSVYLYQTPATIGAENPPPVTNAVPSAAGFVLSGDQLATLTIETVVTRQFYEEILTEGKIGVDEYRSTPVFSPYPGRVVTIFASTGDRVQQGQKLFSVQANEMVQAQNDYLAALNILNKARSQFSFAQAAEKRLHELYDNRVTTLRELQVAQNELTTAMNDLRTAEVGLEAVRNRLRILGLQETDMTALAKQGVINPETAINAPLDGTIIQRKIGPGQYVSTGGGDPSYIIGDLSRVWLIAQLREPDIAKVELGEKVRFRVLAYPDKVFAGKIDYIGSSVDPASRRVYVRSEIDNGKGLLKPEMYASVRIINDLESLSPSIPRAAVIFEGEKAGVWVLSDDNSVENRRIKPGILNGNNLEVLDGLKAGERVVVKGALFVDRLASPG